MAGLRCAELLIKGGLDVTMFEGRDRFGGRCHQTSILGNQIDLGCNQIHGTDHNPFVQLAQRTNTTTYLPEDVHAIFLKDGKRLQGEEALGLYTAVEDLISEGADFSRANTTSIPENLSFWEWFKERVEDLEIDNEQRDRMLQVVQDWGGFVGESIETQSFKNLWMEVSMPGDNLMVASSYSKILHNVAATALKHADIHFSEEVVRIENVEPTGEVLIETASGHRKTCDHVVVTAPLGWLQRNKDAFVPPMPQELSDAIDGINYSRLEKVFIRFPQAWWEGNVDGLGNPDKFASAALFATPEYAPDTNPGKWNHEIFFYSALQSPLAHPTLLFYVYGDNSKLITDAIQGLDPDSQEYHDTLVKFFKPYYSLLPNYNESLAWSKPVKCLTTDWEHDKYAGYGSYTHFTIPSRDGKQMVATIRKGMSANRNIWFAGEHTAPDFALSTIVGAYWSGERVAGEISHLYDRHEAMVSNSQVVMDGMN